MTIKRKRSRRREAMDWIELRREATRLERERQYLKHGTETPHQRPPAGPAAPPARPLSPRADFTRLVTAAGG